MLLRLPVRRFVTCYISLSSRIRLHPSKPPWLPASPTFIERHLKTPSWLSTVRSCCYKRLVFGMEVQRLVALLLTLGRSDSEGSFATKMTACR